MHSFKICHFKISPFSKSFDPNRLRLWPIS
jgi:hypothetical protein